MAIQVTKPGASQSSPRLGWCGSHGVQWLKRVKKIYLGLNTNSLAARLTTISLQLRCRPPLAYYVRHRFDRLAEKNALSDEQQQVDHVGHQQRECECGEPAGLGDGVVAAGQGHVHLDAGLGHAPGGAHQEHVLGVVRRLHVRQLQDRDVAVTRGSLLQQTYSVL